MSPTPEDNRAGFATQARSGAPTALPAEASAHAPAALAPTQHPTPAPPQLLAPAPALLQPPTRHRVTPGPGPSPAPPQHPALDPPRPSSPSPPQHLHLHAAHPACTQAASTLTLTPIHHNSIYPNPVPNPPELDLTLTLPSRPPPIRSTRPWPAAAPRSPVHGRPICTHLCPQCPFQRSGFSESAHSPLSPGLLSSLDLPELDPLERI